MREPIGVEARQRAPPQGVHAETGLPDLFIGRIAEQIPSRLVHIQAQTRHEQKRHGVGVELTVFIIK